MHLFNSGTESAEEKFLVKFSQNTPVDNWIIINDAVMGGLSLGNFIINTAGNASFNGFISLKNKGGFTSVRTKLLEPDLSKYSGISIRIKGDGKKYSLRLKDNFRFDGVSYKAEFQTQRNIWQVLKFPFDNFSATFRGQIITNSGKLEINSMMQLGFLIANHQEGFFELEIEWIKAY